MAQIAAIIAAAGRSRRMGEPKQLLPWGHSTVIATVVNNFTAAGVDPVLCVTGHRHQEIASALTASTAQIVYNELYATTDMLRSYQLGIQTLMANTQVHGTFLALGDQPHISVAVLAQIFHQAQRTPDAIVIPSFQMRRGHPFYFPRCFWGELLTLGTEETVRTVVKAHENAIVYVNVDNDAILYDMDTPDAYAALHNEHGAQ
ncbi:MAG: nucleotidyltransferase family protein [Caldilineaceae bacterium]